MTHGPLTGQVVGGRYRLGDVLGQGGMGVVYRAAQESLARPVAVKVLSPLLAQDVDAIARFRAEAERAGHLSHPHIVQILDFGHEPGGAVWIAMELLAGESLAARIARGPLSEAEVVKVALETLAALEAAHGASLVHRDLKPDNVFLAAVPGIGASVKVLDFGIAKLLDTEGSAKLTATGTLIGTPLYMAPEQARGLPVDARADLYALGVVMYEALAGRPPLTAASYPALLVAILTDAPAPIASLRPELSPELAAIVHRALEKEPDRRFASAAEMASALRALSPSTSVPTRRGVPDAMAMAPTLATPAPAPATRPAEPAAPSAPPTAPAAAPAAAAAPAPAPPTADRSGRLAWLVAAAAGGALAVVLGSRLLESPPTPPPPATATAMATAMTPLGLAPDAGAPTPDAGAPVVPDAGTPTEPDAGLPDAGRAPRTPRAGRDPASPGGSTLPRSAVSVSPSGYRWGGMASSADLRGPIEAVHDWASCWPRDVPAPTVSRGRDFLVDIAADGRVTHAEPTGAARDPEQFGACVVRRLERMTFPPPATGAPAQVRVGFSIE